MEQYLDKACFILLDDKITILECFLMKDELQFMKIHKKLSNIQTLLQTMNTDVSQHEACHLLIMTQKS